MSSKPTLRDIAEATGVSTASVSMILNGKSLERFSSQRVASVLAEAERIGYRTPSARCAGKQIAVLSPSVSNPYHTKMITGIDAAAHAAGYHTAIYNTYWNPRTESHLLDTLDYSRVAGIIFAMTPIQTAKVRELSRRVPIVAVGDRVADCGIDTVDVDNFGAAQLVAKHLIDLGHTRIAYLSTALNEHHISRMRRGEGLQDAYRRWCPEGSVTICSHVNSLEAEISTPDLEYRSGMELAYKCLRNDNYRIGRAIGQRQELLSGKYSAFIAINDMVAFGVLDALQREGYRVPEDFSLCGFDNVTTSGYQRIQLTTVDNNTFSHGKSAFNLLLERIEGGLNSREDQPINRVEYRSRLIVRGSTGKPRSTGL